MPADRREGGRGAVQLILHPDGYASGLIVQQRIGIPYTGGPPRHAALATESNMRIQPQRLVGAIRRVEVREDRTGCGSIGESGLHPDNGIVRGSRPEQVIHSASGLDVQQSTRDWPNLPGQAGTRQYLVRETDPPGEE